MSKKLVSRKQLKEVWGVLYSNAHLLRLEKVGLFPKRVRLSPHPRGRCAWIEDELADWLAERLARRDASS